MNKTSQQIKQRTLPLIFYVFTILIVFPSVPFLKLPGLYQPLRIDFILMAFLVFLYFLQILSTKKLKSSMPQICIILVVTFIYLARSLSPIVAFVQLLGYSSLVVSYLLIKDMINTNRSYALYKIIRLIVYFQVIIHFLGLLGAQYVIDVGGESYTVFGKYGTFGMPFKFGLFCISSLLIINIFNSNKNLILLFLIFAVLTSDSRISIISFLLILFVARPLWMPVLVLMLPLSIILSPKLFILLTDGIFTFFTDPSLLMRIINIQNYISWVDVTSFLLGGGALVFLEYSVQYGKPGPLDFLFLRLLSEFGILIFLIIILKFFKILKSFPGGVLHLIAIVTALIFYSLFNEGIIALRSGNYFFAILAMLTGLTSRKNTI